MKNLSNKLIATIVFVMALIAFNFWHKPDIKTESEKKFENWLSRVEAGAEVNTGFPKLTLTIKDGDTGSMKMYELGEKVSIEKRNRILGLLKEASLKAEESDLKAIESSETAGSIKIQGSSSSFYFPFLKSDLSKNVPAQTMLKLFVIYSENS